MRITTSGPYMTKTVLAILVATGIAFMMSPGALAQDDPPPDPDCEEDPNQLGCDPECADPEVSCEHPPCPTGLTGQALPNGENFMSWTVNSFDDINVYRAEGDGEFVLTDRLEFPATKHLDQDAEPGTTYRYQVTAINETGVESPACAPIEITTIPVFPTPLALVGAGVLGMVAYTGLRCRG